MSMEEWRNSPENARNNPKLSPEDAKRISDEAIAGGQKWDVQEKINARRQAQINAACSQSAGKIQAPAKFDAAIPNPRCQAGAGAFGTYFVHTSQKYGVKLFRDPDTDVSREFDLLGKAHAAGVSVPEPLSLNAVQPANQSSLYDDEPRAQTLVLSHMQGYKTISDVYVSGYGTAVNAPRIVQLKIAREFRKLHTEGMAHGDIHSGNIMVNERSKKVAIVDFGYATELDSPTHPEHYRDGIENLTNDLRRLPEFVGFERVAAADFLERNKGVIANVEKQAQQARDSYRSWDSFELAINRFHDVLEQELLWDERKPRSRFISGANQPRIPGLTRRILTANMNTRNRELVEPLPVDTYFRGVAKQLGIRPGQFFQALKPERDARLAQQRKKPFGTPLQPSARLGNFGPRTRALAADLPGAATSRRLSLAARVQRIMRRSGNEGMSREAALRQAQAEQRGFSSWRD
jgi:hypothetical protein